MKTTPQVHLSDVQAVYSGPEGRLWQLLMGDQIHIGGLQSSTELANWADLREDQQGIDLCCALGAGMRFLLRFRKVKHMTGVDATRAMLELARDRCAEEGMTDRVSFVEADVCTTGLPGGQADFVWGEDAWCYVKDKPELIAEAARLVKPKGRIAFTDWMEGAAGLVGTEAERFLCFMKFPSLASLEDYKSLLAANGCKVSTARDTGRFPAYVPLYIDMIEKQLTYDTLKIIAFDGALAQSLLGEMRFMLSLAKAGKIIQGLIVAEKE